MDSYLKKYADKYDKWLSRDDFAFSSKVIPIHQALDAKQWVMSHEQALSILKAADSYALTACACRTHYQCDKPKEVCFLLNQTADKAVEKNRARRVDEDEAVRVLDSAAKAGLVHLSVYLPGQEVFAFCNCCACCCHDLQLLIKHGRSELVVRSEFIAATDESACTACGMCTDACPFGARSITDDRIVLDPDLCYGCGVCVPVCPEEAISMADRPG